MSGGSRNYLCFAEFPELLERTSDMEDIENDLIQLGITDVAKDVRRLIEYCLSAENKISVLANQLQDVFRAVEWYGSADIGKESLLKYIEEYRNGKRSIEK